MDIFDDFEEKYDIPNKIESEAFNADRQRITDLQPQIRTDIPNEGEVMVSGNPYEAAAVVDWEQGDNIYNVGGNCTLVSTSNVLSLCGIEADEDAVTGYALENGLCEYSPYNAPENNGGAGDEQIIQILQHYGVDAQSYSALSPEGSYDAIAQYVESNHGVEMGLNAGYLWDSADALGNGYVNHQVTVTGSVRDASTGEVTGFMICDSGRGLETDACRYVSTEELDYAYLNAGNASVIVTEEPIREV